MKITARVGGKTVRDVLKCNNLVELRFTDGTCIQLGWVDANGELTEGEPVIKFEGTHIISRPVRIQRPQPSQ